MSGGSGKTIIAIVLVVVIIGAFYLWYTGGSLGSLGGGGASYQSASGITAMGGGGGGGKSSSTDYSGIMWLLVGIGGLGSLGGFGYYFLQDRTLTLSASPPEIRKRRTQGPPIPPDSQTTITAELKFRWWRKPVNKEIEFILGLGAPRDTILNPPAKIVTDKDGKAKTILIAGTDLGTATVYAEYKALRRLYKTTAHIDIGIVNHPVQVPQAPNLDPVKEYIKQKIADKAIDQLRLGPPRDIAQFINCIFGIAEFTPLPDRVLAALKPNPFADDAAIEAAFTARATNPAFDTALNAVLNSTHQLGGDIATLIRTKEREIRVCHRGQGGGGGGHMASPLSTYTALQVSDVWIVYTKFNESIKESIEHNLSDTDFLMWKLFDIKTNTNQGITYKTLVSIKLKELETRLPLNEMPCVLEAIRNAEVEQANLNTTRARHRPALPQIDITDDTYHRFAAMALVDYFMDGGTTAQKYVYIDDTKKKLIGAGIRTVGIRQKTGLINSFFDAIAYDTHKIGSKSFSLFEKKFDTDYKEIKTFFENWDILVKGNLLVPDEDYDDAITLSQVKVNDQRGFARAYATYHFIKEYLDTTKKADELKKMHDGIHASNDQIREIVREIKHDHNRMITEEQGTGQRNNSKAAWNTKEALYTKLWGQKRLFNAWTKIADVTTLSCTIFKNLSLKNFKSTVEDDDIIDDLVADGKLLPAEKKEALEIAYCILTLLPKATIKSTTALKSYLYLLTEYVMTLEPPRAQTPTASEIVDTAPAGSTVQI